MKRLKVAKKEKLHARSETPKIDCNYNTDSMRIFQNRIMKNSSNLDISSVDSSIFLGRFKISRTIIPELYETKFTIATSNRINNKIRD